ncbi:MAG: heavy metal-binding domain-containing protein [Cyanobacteria bacterium TGS_CYA1]|nr:heavy metal-binding domain-containing protein [Cyanobacteria bacterium TGS_CYA1]MDX2106685.1 heavy metal-binding domain-containing protein [Candidatus Melainabacteria bacterium]
MPDPNENEIPEHAHERLKHMKGTGGKRVLFTSDLSVNEFLLIKEAGFEPAGLVVGSSIYHIGFQFPRLMQNMEMDVLTQALYHARELAMTRMQAEAQELDADGIVGVRLHVKHMSWNQDLAEFVAIGTAVYNKNGDKSFRAPNGKPFTSDLSGQDFWTLLRSGYRPVGMVMGNCVYHIAYQSIGQWFQNIGKNVEMTNFTQGLYDARELAMERMQVEAEQVHAEGIVGVNITEGNYGWSSHVLEFFSVGTAIVPMREDHHIPTPQLVMSVND